MPAPVIDLAYLIHRFLLAAADEIHAMKRILDVRAPSTTWRRRLEASAQLASSLMTRIMARAMRAETGLAARGIEGPIRPLSARATLSVVRILISAVPLPLLLLCRWCVEARG